MQGFKKQLSRINIIHYFPLFYIGATVIIIVSGYLVGSYREIEEYKKITSWYEKLEDNSSSELSEFIKKAQDKLGKDFASKISDSKVTKGENIDKKIIIYGSQDRPKDALDNSANWETKKTGSTVTVYYGYVGASNFSGETLANNETIISKIKTDEVFLKFADRVIDNDVFNIKSNKVKDLNSFTKAVMKYLVDDDKYIKSMPYLKINNIYITSLETKFLLSYPLTEQKYEENEDVDFRKRPWFKATENGTASFNNASFNKQNPKTGLTDVYIDINDGNAMRTLFYRFKDDQEQEYI
ncbi:MAG: hypothetical protein ACKPJF_17285, partial [Dolichospermum sp.]